MSMIWDEFSSMTLLRWARRCTVVALIVGGWTISASPAGAQTPSCGCSLTPPAGPGQSKTIRLSGSAMSRDGAYVLYVPEGYSAQNPMPLVVGLHGWTSSGSSMKRGSGLDKTSDRFGFVSAFPDGVGYPSAGRGWAFPGCNASPDVGMTDECGRRAVCEVGDTYNCDSTTCSSPWSTCSEQCSEELSLCLEEPTPSCPGNQCGCTMEEGTNCNWCGCVDDQAFLRAVVEDIGQRMCIDLDRVYLTGMSAGGMMTSWMSGEVDSPFAAFAPQSGTDPRDFYRLAAADADVGVMWIHGTRDSTVPHDGSRASDGYRYEAAQDQAGNLAFVFGCSGTESTWQIPASVQAPANADLVCREFGACAEADITAGTGTREVVYCLWDGGHQWPKAVGKAESAHWGNRLMWEFFSRHDRQAEPPACEPPPPIECSCDASTDPCSSLASKSACQEHNTTCGAAVCSWSGNPTTGSCACASGDDVACKEVGGRCKSEGDCCTGLTCLDQPRGPSRCG